MGDQEKEFITCMKERIADCKQFALKLNNEGRAEESVFENIRINIYEIFKTVFSAAKKSYGKDEIALKNFFLQKLEQIPESWKTSYEKAEKHGDSEKTYIENIKLKTAKEVKEIFEKTYHI